MNKFVILPAITLFTLMLLLFPDVAYAGPAEWGVKTFHMVLYSIGDSLIAGVWPFLQKYLLDPTTLGAKVNTYVSLAKWIAYGWLVYLATQKFIIAMYQDSVGIRTQSAGQLFLQAAISVVMVSLVQELIGVIIQVNNWLVIDIANFGSGIKNFHGLMTRSSFKNTESLSVFYVGMAMSAVFLAITAAIRYMQIVVYYVTGPFMMIEISTFDYVKMSGFFKGVFITIFTQSLQLLVLDYTFMSAVRENSTGYLLGIAGIWSMILMPFLLRRLLAVKNHVNVMHLLKRG